MESVAHLNNSDQMATRVEQIRQRLQSWGVTDPIAWKAAAFLPQAEREGEAPPGAPPIVLEWLRLYHLTIKPGRGIDNPPDAYSLKLRQLMRAGYQNLPLALLAVADHAVRLETVGQDNGSERFAPLWRETREVFIPLLEMFGMWQLRQEWVEAWAQALYPAEYRKLGRQLRKAADRQESLFEFIRDRAPGLTVRKRPMLPGRAFLLQRHGVPLADLFTRFDVDIIAPDAAGCYAALGVFHAVGMPIKGRFSDYIAHPYSNGYAALYTSVTLDRPGREAVNARIYSPKMEIINQYGVAAPKAQTSEVAGAWWQQELADDHPLRCREINENQKDDKFIYVFTPRGELFTLKNGSVAIDFAYRLHSHIGHHCRDIHVNGHSVRYDARLYNGDLVEVVHDPLFLGPHPAWLSMTGNKRTREKIKQGLGLTGRVKHPGRQRLEKYLRSIEQESGFVVPEPQLDKYLSHVMRELELGDYHQLYDMLERPNRHPRPFSIDKLVALILEEELKGAVLNSAGHPLLDAEPEAKFRFCQNCRPTPAAPIVLHRRSGKRPSQRTILTLHRAKPAEKHLYGLPSSGVMNCMTSLKTVNADLDFQVKWGQIAKNRRWMNVTVLARNHSGLLGELLQPIYDNDRIDLQFVRAAAGGEGLADVLLSVEYHANEDISALEAILEKKEGVIRVSMWPAHPSQAAHLKSRHAGRIGNPYNSGAPLLDNAIFFGREDEMQRIKIWIDDEIKLITLYGQRRCGKTTLARQLIVELKGLPIIPIYVDLLGSNHNLTPQQIYYDIACAIHRTLFEQVSTRPLLSWEQFAQNPFAALKNYLRESYRLFTPRRLLLILDEFNLLVARQPQSPIFDNLRSLAHELPFVTLALVTHTPQYQGVRASPASRELYMQSQGLQVKALDDIAARELIKKPMQGRLEFEDDVVNQLIAGTDGNPYLIQVICFRIVDRSEQDGRAYVRLQDLRDTVANDLLPDGETYFHFLLGQIADEKKTALVVKQVAYLQGNASKWVSLSQINAAKIGSPGELKRIIGYCEQHGILAVRQPTGGNLQFRLPMQYFCDWINKNPAHFLEVIKQVYES